MHSQQASLLLKTAVIALAAIIVTGTPAALAEDKPTEKEPKVQADNYVAPAEARKFELAINPLNPALTQPEALMLRMTAGDSVSTPQQQYFYALAQYIVNYNKKLSWDEASQITNAILHFSDRYGVDFRLLTGLIAVESSFRSDAVSSSGAIGLGQLKPDTAKWLGVVDPYNPVDNIAGTARFLGWLLRKYNGSMDHALSAYYQGPGTVDRQGITPACIPYLLKVNKALGRMASN